MKKNKKKVNGELEMVKEEVKEERQNIKMMAMACSRIEKNKIELGWIFIVEQKNQNHSQLNF